MGCTPVAVKDKSKIPATNSFPSGRVAGPTTSLDNIVTAASKLTHRDYDEITRYDLTIKDERPTPNRIEKIDFINKQYIPTA